MEFLRRSIITPFTSENRKRISSELLPKGILLYGPPGISTECVSPIEGEFLKMFFWNDIRFILNLKH